MKELINLGIGELEVVAEDDLTTVGAPPFEEPLPRLLVFGDRGEVRDRAAGARDLDVLSGFDSSDESRKVGRRVSNIDSHALRLRARSGLVEQSSRW